MARSAQGVSHWIALSGFVIVVVLVLRLIGLLPTWPYSPGWGYYPSGGLGLLLLIVVIVLLLGGGKGRPG